MDEDEDDKREKEGGADFDERRQDTRQAAVVAHILARARDCPDTGRPARPVRIGDSRACLPLGVPVSAWIFRYHRPVTDQCSDIAKITTGI